jgi:predicted transcriptional regulator
MTRKPRIFIGSSVESLPIADAINENLDHSCEVTIWRNGTFNLSNNTIDSLLEKAAVVDFAVFIFSPDDLLTIRQETKQSVRDNVIFELGLFIGTIGKQRCFIVKPRNIILHFPTDLLGVTAADYEPNRSDGDLASSLNLACSLMKKEVLKLGLVPEVKLSTPKHKISLHFDQKLDKASFQILFNLLKTVTSIPGGVSTWNISNDLKMKDERIHLSLIKLERLGLIQKENMSDYDNNFYYSYTLTQDGVEYLLTNENEFSSPITSSESPLGENSDNLPF